MMKILTFKTGYTAVLLGMILFLFSCEKKEPSDPPIEKSTRTVLFYMGADCYPLTPDANAKINSIQAGLDDHSGKVLVYFDSQYDPPRLIELYRTKEGENTRKIVKEYPEENSADAEIFKKVIREVTELYPSESYGLVLFSHGTGWLPEGAFNNPSLRSVIFDDEDGVRREMEVTALANAIPDHQFDFIIFEACLMGGVELAYELKDKTDYLVVSAAEIVQPGFQEIYQKTMPYLFEKEANLTAFSKAYFDCWNAKSGLYRSATVSLIKTAALEDLAKGINRFYKNEIPNIVDLSGIQDFGRLDGGVDFRGLYFDMQDYYEHLFPSSVHDELNTLLNNCVIYKDETPGFLYPTSPSYRGFQIQTHCGLTVYVEQDRFPHLNTACKNLKWYEAIHQ